MPTKRRVDTWYEIHEWIGPNEAVLNQSYWSAVHTGDHQRYLEGSLAKARAKFAEIEPGRRFRLVRVTQEVLEVKE